MNIDLERLHADYVKFTGLDIRLTATRESTWAEWLRFRRHDPFTSEDLELVVKYLKKEIKAGHRFPPSLFFNKLIGNPDYFEEDLAMAKVKARKPKVDRGKAAVLKATGRDPNPPSGKTVSVGEVIAAMRKAAGK